MVKKFHLRDKTWILKKNSAILEFSVLRKKIANFKKIRIFEHHWVLKYSMGKNLTWQTWIINKLHLAILKFLNKTWKIAKFQKIRIFEHNLSLNCSMVKKFHMRSLDLHAKKSFSAIFVFSILRGRELLNFDKFGFSNMTGL